MIEQIENAFGLKLKAEPVSQIKGLPIYMSNGRSFCKAETAGISFLLVSLSEDDRFGVVALEKQLARYIEVVGMNVAFVFPRLTKVQRDALTARNIPFISLPDQLYLPFLGIALQNRFRKEKQISAEKMTPATQILFLYFLYTVKDGRVMKKKAAEDLGLTRTSITRASNQLAAMGLIKEETVGKETHMKAVQTGSAFLAQAEPYLADPVFRRWKVKRCQELADLPAAGETALSLKSMLNEPVIRGAAILKSDPLVKKLQVIEDKWEPENDVEELELWKYDPSLFAKDQIVDPVSMMLSLQDVQDERVEGELREYMEAIRW